MTDSGRSTLIEQAIKLIGSNPEGNYRIGSLEKQIASLEPEAAGLRSALSDQRVVTDARLLAKYDGNSNGFQRSFKRHYRAAFLVLLFTAVASAAAIAWPLRPEDEAWLQPLAMILVSASLLGSLLIALRIRRCRLYEKWQEHRANAEFLRRIHFENVLDAEVQPADPPGVIPLQLLKLEYFRRYQLEVQHAYHTVRGGQHERRAELAHVALYICLAFAGVWILLFLLAMGDAWFEQGVMPDWMPDWMISFLSSLEIVQIFNMDKVGLLAVLTVSTIYGLLMIMVRLDDNVRNAARYEAVRGNLAYLKGKPLDEARAGAAKGGKVGDHAVRHFIAEVHGIMSNELADWVRLRELESGREQLARGELPVG